MNEEIDSLAQWFAGQTIPIGHFRISPWEHTNDLTHTVNLAIEHARTGNTTSLEMLKRIKDKLTK